ncbi:MAG: DUF3616 domain-containing protein [Acidobacteriota bacterium]
MSSQEIPAQTASSHEAPSHPASSEAAPANLAQQTIVISSPETAAAAPDQASSKALLRVLLPNGDVFDKEINKPEVQIGKGPRNDVVIADPAVSTSHAVLRFVDNVYTIADVGSRNGTFVNSERITDPKKLAHGDVIGVGLSKLTFRLQGHSETSVIDVAGLVQAQYAPPPLTEESFAAAIMTEGFASRSRIEQMRGRGRRLARALLDEKLIPEDRLRDLMNRVFQIPAVDLRSTHIDENVTVNFSSRIARDHSMFAFRREGDALAVAVFDPTDTDGVEKIRLEMRTNVRVMVATASEISEQIEKFYGPKIIGVLPSGEKLRFLITNQHEISIGKAPHNEIVLKDPTVSNTHAVIMIRDGGYSIVDLGSRNGTFVNGERLSTHARTLLHGDSIQLGQTVLTFRNSGQTTQNATAVLSLEAIEEIRRRAGYADLGLEAQPAALQPVGHGAGMVPQQAMVAGQVLTGEVVEEEPEKKKKKKKKKKEDDRIRAAYISSVSRIVAQVVGAAATVGLTLAVTWYALRPATQPGPTGPGSTEIPVRPGEKNVFSRMGTITPLRGGFIEASGVIHVPDSNGVLFVADSKEKQVLYTEFDQSGNQTNDPQPKPLGTTAAGVEVSVKDPEAITYGSGFFYMIGGQGEPAAGEKNALVRFVFDRGTQSVRDAEIITDLRSFLLTGVTELQGEGERPGAQGGLNIEGIAWDPGHERLLLGLRSPLPGGSAMIIPLKLRDPRGSFTRENLTIDEPRVIRVNLEGFGIRDIHFDAHLNSFLIISGAPDPFPRADFKLWQWSGDANSQPKAITDLNSKMKPEGVTRVRIEGRDYLLIFGDDSKFIRFDYADPQ